LGRIADFTENTTNKQTHHTTKMVKQHYTVGID